MDSTDFPPYLPKYSSLFNKSNQTFKKNPSEVFYNKNGLCVDSCEQTYRFTPSSNHCYLDSKTNFVQAVSNCKSKTVLRTSFNSSGFKTSTQKQKNLLQKEENLNKLKSLISIQKRKLNEKHYGFFENRNSLSKFPKKYYQKEKKNSQKPEIKLSFKNK